MTYETIFPLIGTDALYSAFFEALPGYSYLLKTDAPKYTVLAVSPGHLKLTGRKKEDIVGKGIFEILPGNPDDPVETGTQDLRASLNYVLENKKPHQLPVRRYDIADAQGRFMEKYWHSESKPVLTPEGEVAYIIHSTEDIGTDVTDKVLSTKEVGESEQRFQNLVREVARKSVEAANQETQFVTDFVPQMIWVTRPDGYHYYYNKQWYDYTGLTYGETEGEGWNGVFHPDDQERAWKLWRHSLATGEPYEIEYRCRRFDGEYRWVLGRALPLRDESGTILKWFGTCTDIHDQKIEAELLEDKVAERTRELQIANQELARSNVNLGEFAYAASHDLKEPIRKIHFFADRLRTTLAGHLNDDQIRNFERLETSARRMSSLIDNLLSFSQVNFRSNVHEEVDLDQLIDVVLEDLDLEMEEKKATVEVDKLFTVKGHHRQLQQAFHNLIGNAIKYSKPGVPPKVHINCGQVLGKETGFHLSELQMERSFYCISVRDNGIGFEQADAERIFNIFTRLHGNSEYKGTGIGLSIVRKVIENHNGYIQAESAPGEGAIFKIYLPVEQ